MVRSRPAVCLIAPNLLSLLLTVCYESDSKYVALKIYVTGQKKNHELEIYNRMDAAEVEHPGRDLIRKLFDHFTITGPHGPHVCLVHDPMGMSADTLLQKYIPGKAMTLDEMKSCIRQLLIALDFLHSFAHIVHTGKNPDSTFLIVGLIQEKIFN